MEECTLPLTGYRCVDLIITEKCVFHVDPETGLKLTEIADDVTVAEVQAATGVHFEVSRLGRSVVMSSISRSILDWNSTAFKP